jgi:hypothetical protein
MTPSWARSLLCASLLGLLLLPLSLQQPISEQLQSLKVGAVPSPLYEYNLNGQTLYTACPCQQRWQYTLSNRTVVELSGCANPENSPAVS